MFKKILHCLSNFSPDPQKLDLTAPWNIPFARVASAEDIFYCFRLLLGRHPHKEEWSGHSAREGADFDEVVKGYVNSLEFSRRLQGLIENKFDDRLVLKELDGFKLYVQPSDLAVGRPIMEGGVHESHVTAVFRNRIGTGMSVLDVGANLGYFTMLATSLVGPSGHVMAIEPNPGNIKLLEASRRANAFANVTVVQAAAGRELGLLMLNTSHSNGTTSALSNELRALIDSVTVPSMKIDELMPQDRKLDFIKIDIEGAEFNALLGAAKTIQRWHPIIVSEFAPDMMPMIAGVDGPAYLQLLIDFGYKIAVIEQDGTLTDCKQDIAQIMNAYEQSRGDHIDILAD